MTNNNLTFKIEEFEGPLDLMLEMFKKHKLEIEDVNIEFIIDQYLAYIEVLNKEEYEIATVYLEFAAELILYKSKKVLELDEEEEVEVDLSMQDLVSQILEYKRYKEVAGEIDELQEDRYGYLLKEESNLSQFANSELDNIDLNQFIKSAIKVINRKQKEEQDNQSSQVSLRKELNVDDLYEDLKKEEYIDFEKEITGKNKEEVITFFLAILELLKLDEFGYKEENNNLYLYKRKEN